MSSQTARKARGNHLGYFPRQDIHKDIQNLLYSRRLKREREESSMSKMTISGNHLTICVAVTISHFQLLLSLLYKPLNVGNLMKQTENLLNLELCLFQCYRNFIDPDAVCWSLFNSSRYSMIPFILFIHQLFNEKCSTRSCPLNNMMREL